MGGLSEYIFDLDRYIYTGVVRVFAFVNHGFYKFLKTIPLCRNKVQVRPSKNQSKQLFEKSDYWIV